MAMAMDAHSRFSFINGLQSFKNGFLKPQQELLRRKVAAEEVRVRSLAQRAHPNAQRIYRRLAMLKESMQLVTNKIREVCYNIVSATNSIRGTDDVFMINIVDEVKMLRYLRRAGVWTGDSAFLVVVNPVHIMRIRTANNGVLNLVALPAPNYNAA